MEVHHHPHVAKKGFKEYFLEFIMIFLAVTLGFFAESIRENINNGKHAKLLATQLSKDLKADTFYIQQNIAFWKLQIIKADSLSKALSVPLAATDKKLIQSLIFQCYSTFNFTPATGAISAIEKELNIKEFINSNLPGDIATYQQILAGAKSQEGHCNNQVFENIQPFVYAHITADNAQRGSTADTVTANNFSNQMRNLAQNDLDELNTRMMVRIGSIQGMIWLDSTAKEYATKLLQYTQQHFHVK